MKILITGGTGFIGQHVLRKFNSKSYKILSLTRKNIKKKNNINFIKNDFFKIKSYYNKIKLFAPDIIIHCGWYGVDDYNDKKNCQLNLKYSKIFLNFVINLKSVKKVLICGSNQEIKNKTKSVSENCKLGISNNFPLAKTSLLKFVKKKIKRNQKYYWLRIFYAYGLGNREKNLIQVMCKNLKENKPFKINSPDNKLDYIYVEDIADYFFKIIEKNPKSGIYNVASGKKTSLRFIFNFLKSKINPKYNYNVFGSLKSNVNYCASTKKTLSILKWKPKFSIKKGLEKIARKK